jgi:hypothetical protein
MNTISVDIEETELMNFITVSSSMHGLNEEGHNRLFDQFPFKLYKNRMMGEYMVTIQIPIVDYFLFLGNDLVK